MFDVRTWVRNKSKAGVRIIVRQYRMMRTGRSLPKYTFAFFRIIYVDDSNLNDREVFYRAYRAWHPGTPDPRYWSDWYYERYTEKGTLPEFICRPVDQDILMAGTHRLL